MKNRAGRSRQIFATKRQCCEVKKISHVALHECCGSFVSALWVVCECLWVLYECYVIVVWVLCECWVSGTWGVCEGCVRGVWGVCEFGVWMWVVVHCVEKADVSAVNAWVLRGHCDRLRRFMRLTLDVFVFCSKLSGVNCGQLRYFGTLSGVNCRQFWYFGTPSGVNCGKFWYFNTLQAVIADNFGIFNTLALPTAPPIH